VPFFQLLWGSSSQLPSFIGRGIIRLKDAGGSIDVHDRAIFNTLGLEHNTQAASQDTV
jgi:hypothetical protein